MLERHPPVSAPRHGRQQARAALVRQHDQPGHGPLRQLTFTELGSGTGAPQGYFGPSLAARHGGLQTRPERSLLAAQEFRHASVAPLSQEPCRGRCGVLAARIVRAFSTASFSSSPMLVSARRRSESGSAGSQSARTGPSRWRAAGKKKGSGQMGCTAGRRGRHGGLALQAERLSRHGDGVGSHSTGSAAPHRGRGYGRSV
jgi:hypothetical protein